MSEETLFELALRTPEAERAALLDRACEGKPELRARVEALLKADAAPAKVFTPPTAFGVTTGFEGPVRAAAGDVPGTVIAGRYKLLEEIGEGGMGTVWMAQQSEPVKRRVALKLIKAGMDSKSVLQRFEQERQALAIMDHPNIAKVLDGGLTEDRRPFFVMELVNGLPLTKFCDDVKLGISERLELFIPICQAVQHAHQKGIIHRDLKPNNILVTMVDGKPVPKVIDFGVAKSIGGKLTDESLFTQFGAVVGTLEYMAPEQTGFSNQDIDTRADIYSLGVILYELLTGLRPYDTQRLKQAAFLELIRIIQEDEPSKPSTRISTNESLPSLAAVRLIEPRKLTALLRGELDWIVMRCLEKKRDHRYDTANNLARDIQRYLADETVEARPPTLGYRASKFIRRNRGLVLTAGLILSLLLLAIVGTSWGLVQAEQQRDRAEQATIAEAKRAEGEQQAKIQAEKRLKQIEKSNAILGSIFATLDPKEVARAERPLQAIVVEQIDHAVEQLQAETIGDPLVVATMQDTLARSLLGLSEPAKAMVLLEKSLATRRSLLGNEHPETLESMNNLADACQSAGRLASALQLMRDTLALSLSKLGPEHPKTLIAKNNLASAYLDAGKVSLALPLFEETYLQRKKLLGPDHPQTLATMNNLAMALQATGNSQQAIPLLEDALPLLTAKLGQEHPNTLSAMNNLAMAYFALGRRDEAVKLFEQTLAVRRSKLGPEHLDTLASMNNLASGYQSLGKMELAIPLLEETVSRLRAKWGPDHPGTLTASHNLARSYQSAGKADRALPILEDTLNRRKAKLGPDHPDTLATMDLLAQSLLSLKKWSEAEKTLRAGLALRQSKSIEAWPTYNTMSQLGGALLGQKKYVEAEPLLLSGYEGMKKLEAKIPVQGKARVPEALDRLVQLYTETNKPEEVKKWQAEKDKLTRPREKK